MSEKSDIEKFSIREFSWSLSHRNKQSHLAVFATQNGLALAVLVYMNENALETVNFSAVTTSDARDNAIEWAKRNIDPNISASKH